MTAGNTFTPTVATEADTPDTRPTTTPASAETTAEIAQDTANTCRTDTPRLCATCWSNAVARMARPSREYLKNQAKPAMITSEMARLMR